MKESVLIDKLNRGQNERLQNNQMIQGVIRDLGEMQQFVVGLLATMRKLPGYDAAIKELADENAAKEMEVNEPEEVKPEIDLGKECCGKDDCGKC